MDESVKLSRVLEDRFAPFDRAPTAMLVADRKGVIVYANQLAAATFDYECEELIGSSVDVLIPTDVRAVHTHLRQAYTEYPATRRMGASRDLEGLSRSGRRVPVEIGLTPLRLEGVDLTLAFVLDLTGRTRQEDRFRAVTEAASHGLVMVNREGTIVLANGAACSMFGYEKGQLLGQTIEMLVPRDRALKHRVYRASYAERTEVRPMGFGRDLFGKRSDGTEFPVEIGLMPLDSDDGRFIVATVIDLTERKRIETEIRRSNEHLLRLNEELSGFSYSVSHDLKSPLASICGLVDLAARELAENDLEGAAETLAKIGERGRHAGQLVDDILDLARTDFETGAVEDVDLRATVQDVLVSLGSFAEQRKVELINDVPHGLSALSQAVRLRQVLKNLASNAVKYSCDQNGPPFARVSASASGDRIEIQVEDNGLGIPADCRHQVFGMFQRFHPQHSDGSGLGLALVKKHVESLGGTIRFESSAQGSSFVVAIPEGERTEQ